MIKNLIKDLFKPRTLFATLFYCTFCFLILKNRTVPKELSTIVLMLLSFYFGQRTKKNDNEKTKIHSNNG